MGNTPYLHQFYPKVSKLLLNPHALYFKVFTGISFISAVLFLQCISNSIISIKDFVLTFVNRGSEGNSSGGGTIIASSSISQSGWGSGGNDSGKRKRNNNDDHEGNDGRKNSRQEN